LVEKEASELRLRLHEEESETRRLQSALNEQQQIIKAALRRIFPEQFKEEGEVEICEEHLATLKNYAAKLKEDQQRKE